MILKFTLKSFVQLFKSLGQNEYKDFILHSFQVAKISSLITKRLGFTNWGKVYLLGLLHDVGFLLRDLKDTTQHILLESLDTERTIERYDLRNIHPAISYLLLKNTKFFGEEELAIVLYHHENLDGGSAIEPFMTIFRLADSISRNLTKIRRFDDYATVLPEVWRKVKMRRNVPESVKKITLEILEDYTLVEQLLDDNPHFEIFSGFFDQVIDIDTFIEFAKIISLILGTRSIFTRNHLSLVARTSEAIARSMLGTLDGKVMKLAGFVHDVGKIKTPLSILHKKGKLTDEEWILMKKHVVDTVHTLQEADLRFLAVICGAHHERLDGSGYPMGLVEDQMTIYQKILQVADVYSALIERRPYRSAVSYREALDIVKKEVEKGRLDEKVFNELKNVVLSEPALMRTRYSDVLKDFFGDHYREIAEILKDVLWSRGSLG